MDGVAGEETGARRGRMPRKNTSTFLVTPSFTAKICELYPSLEETNAIEAIIPKKSAGALAKWYRRRDGERRGRGRGVRQNPARLFSLSAPGPGF